MDYTFADRTVIPEFDQTFFTEQLAYLTDSYQANNDQRQLAYAPRQRSEVGPPENAFVSCCMNSVERAVPALLDIWMRMLKRFLGSLLSHARTTGIDALRAGLPLLTCIGPTLAGRRLRCSNQRLTRGILTGPLRPWLGVTAQACHHLPSTCQCAVEPPFQWGNSGC